MWRQNPLWFGVVCSKLVVFRAFFLFGLLFFTYLCIYKIDLRSTIALGQSMLTPIANANQSILTKTNPDRTTAVNKTVDKKEPVTTLTPSLVNRSNMTPTTKEAFVTFSNNAPMYLSLLKALLDSVHAFSTRPIIAYGIDVDLDINLTQYPRVIKRRLKQSDCGPSVYFCKLHAIVDSNVEYGVLMETDDVVNYNVDVLFELLHVWPYPIPLSPRHPDDPQNYGHFMQQHHVPRRTTPYIHAHVIWTYRAWPFLKNVHELLRQGNFQGSNFDETAMNVMYWKAEANHTVCKYDPYFTFSDAYEKWPEIKNCTKYCHTAFITLHGCKEAHLSLDLLTRLKANAGKPAIQSYGMGGMTHINDTRVTCCYPDSKQSPIHPLLCEHTPPM